MMRRLRALVPYNCKPRSSQARGKLTSQCHQAQRKRALFFERLETRHLLAGDWQNPLFNLDVNDDVYVSPIDALLIINSLNSLGARELTEPFDNDSPTAAYWDVNGDGFVAPSDALALINNLNQPSPSLPVALALANDSGASAMDGVTNDSRVQGQVALGGAGIPTAKVRVNRDDVLPLSLDAEGRFELDPRLLSSFTEGAAKIGVFVSTASGAQALFGLRLTLDATPPPSPTVASFSADSGVLGDGITTDDTLQVTGSAEPGILVNVFFQGSREGTVVASPDGSWSFGAASKDDGVYAITVVAEDAAGNASPASGPLVVTIASGLLGGAVDDPANLHIPDVAFPDASVDDLSLDDRPEGTGLETSRTRLMVQFTDTATVGQVNTLLQSLDARIIGAMTDIDLVLIGIPDTGNFSGLDSALATLNSHPAVALAVQDVALKTTSLPAPTIAQDSAGNAWVWSSPPSDVAGGLDGNWGLEAVRAPQMWSLNDFGYGQEEHPITGVLDSGFNDMNDDGANDHPDADVAGLRTWRWGGPFGIELFLRLGATSNPGAGGHGQHVAGIIGANFDNSIGVEGINPLVERDPAPAANLSHFIGVSARMRSSALLIEDLTKMMRKWDFSVINISLGYGSSTVDPNTSSARQTLARQEGLLVRQVAALHPDTIIVASAGNDSNLGFTNEVDAQWASPFGWAGLGGTLINANGASPNSPNILVVESVDGLVANSAVPTPSYAWQYTKSDFSNVGGDVSAPGGRILSTVGTNIIRDDDGDGLFDEDPINPSIDDDGDGLFDEDPINIPSIDDDGDGFFDEDPITSIDDDGDGGFDEDPIDYSNYLTYDGTSMAAPQVTGLIGYLLTLDPDLTVAQIRTLLTQPQFTRTTQLRAVESPYPASIVNQTPAPMIDAFSAALGIDLVTDDATKSIQRALVDVDDGSPDGNLRVDPLTGHAVTQVSTADEPRGDGQITMRDFRAWRDAYLQLQSDKFLEAGLSVALDGGDHVKKDLNFNGVVATDDDYLYPRYDFNGDGSVLAWSATAPFKIDPDTPLGGAAAQNTSTDLESTPGFLRDIDVLADPAFWSEFETDLYNEGVTVTPASEGAANVYSQWTESRYLLENRDPDSASDFLKDLPDYIHSFDVHVSIDWTALDYGDDAVLLRIDSEMAGPSFGEHFRREAVVPYGAADFVVTIPLWTGRVQVRVAGFDRDAGTLPDLDLGDPRESWPDVKIGEDKALKLGARDYTITNLGDLLESYGVTSSTAAAINNLGDVVVDGYDSATQASYLFLVERSGVVTDLTPLIGVSGGDYLSVAAINDSRQIAGTRYDQNGEVVSGFIYQYGQTPALIELGANLKPLDMNDAGEVVGIIADDVGGSFLYRGGSIELIPRDADRATGINNLGDVVGILDARVYLYRRDGEFIDIGLPPGQTTGFLRDPDINDSGQIAGVYQPPGSPGQPALYAPFIWEEGIWTFPFRSPFGGISYFGGLFYDVTLNESGAAVGNTGFMVFDPPSSYYPWIFSISGGSNISNLDPPNSPFSKLLDVGDINDRGDIVGTGELPAPRYRGAFVLTRVL